MRISGQSMAAASFSGNGRRVALGSLTGFLFLGTACSEAVKVPKSAAQDQVPTVTIGYVRNTAGSNQPPGTFMTATQSGTLQLPTEDWQNKYVLTASASNPKGGIKELKLFIGQPGHEDIDTFTHSQTPDSNGEVLPSLSITGTNGQGGNGPTAILISPAGTPPEIATATATNFNGQTTSIRVVFAILAPPPTINEFSVTPNDNDPTLGRIYASGSATLKWKAFCGPGVSLCNVTIRGADGEPQYTHQTLVLPGLQFNGTIKVTPQQNSKYTLKVTNVGNGTLSTSKSVTVSIYQPPSMSGLQVFYFKINCNSSILPCFTQVIYSQTKMQAQQLAILLNGNCTATEVSAQEFLNGCGH